MRLCTSTSRRIDSCLEDSCSIIVTLLYYTFKWLFEGHHEKYNIVQSILYNFNLDL
jgi:hypothetical protein